MSVRKLKDGRYKVFWRDPDQGNKVVCDSFGRGEAAHKAAIERDLEIKLEKSRRPAPKPGDVGVPTFREFAQTYINARAIELSEKTVAEILRTATRYALPLIGALPITRISMAHWAEIEKGMLARQVTARTINKYFQYFSRMFAWAVERDYLKDNPWARRKALRIKNKFQIELLTPAEFQAILDAADDHLRWAIEVELYTGVRPGPTELFALKWDDFDYETGAVRIYSSKTDTTHIQYVPMEFIEKIEARRAQIREEDLRLAKRRGEIRPECPYVISFRGEPVKQLANAWKAAKTKAGIERPVRLYDIRHFHITHALAGGASLLDLANRVGHKNANMIVNVYAHLVTEMQTKKPFDLPKFEFGPVFKQDTRRRLLAKPVSQDEKGLRRRRPNTRKHGLKLVGAE